MHLDPARLAPVVDDDTVGDLRAWTDIDLPGLDRRADLSVWLPSGYDDAAASARRYPVVYLHDGGNLFLRATSFAGATWRVGEAMSALDAEGIPAIVVGIPSHPTDRAGEYTPHPHAEHGGGRVEEYAVFLADHLKPAIDRTLRTEPGPTSTIVAGSSLGAIASAYLWQTRPESFGGAGLFSTSFWFPGERAIDDLAAALREPRTGARVYLDVGGREGANAFEAEVQVSTSELALRALRASDVPVRYVYDSTAPHHEDAWAERLPAALRWLLAGWDAGRPRG
ncbi:MAG: alpha/beta hydrolase [Salana multivorans]|uniref:alpha/beta hydrolase n=1 Tax=Salana multivorans TaxID=120377 RepID=UPI00095B509A|nr:alpha/beta hydrolase-fold protein [Salana multivorans]MBN8882805.1 alpha/beta hydrolase [Salana multivorans]OJX97524.1 MAG: hypothetical protein BGO96_04770 [Micrococcales bacterium 73-15]